MKQFAVVVALAFATLGAPTSASQSVPFRAVIDTQIAPLGPCGIACLTVSIGGAGQGLHVGRTSISGPSQIDFATGAQSGTSTLEAADGSTLTIAFDGTFVPGPGPEDAAFSGDWTVTSGTGRFEGASGGGSYHGTASGPTGVLHMEGTLSNPGRR